MFLYIDPLKQGLKQQYQDIQSALKEVFIHRSIKTRIETSSSICLVWVIILFLYIDPLKQGLKQERKREKKER